MIKVLLILIGMICCSNRWGEGILLTWKTKEDSLKICEMKRNARLLQMGEQAGKNSYEEPYIPSYNQAKGWDITILDSAVGSEVYGTSLALDSQDNPHIAYGKYSDKIIYTFWDFSNSKWVYETLGGANQSLAVDSADYPHIACFFNGLGYLVKSDSGWDTIQPYPGPWVDWTSIALDSKGRPHIGWTWWAWSNAEMILYTYWDDTIWKTDTVDTIMCYPGAALAAVSLALDAANTPYLAYTGNGKGERLRHAMKVGENWEIEIVDTTATDTIYGDGWPSLKIDRLNIPCVIYAGGANSVKGEKYARRETIGWKIEKLDTIGWSENSLCIDNNNNPHISCRRRYSDGYWLQYAWKDTNGWQINKIENLFIMALNLSYTSVAIDNNGLSHISYRANVNNYYAGKYVKGIGVGIEEKSNIKSPISKLIAWPNPFLQQTVIQTINQTSDNRLKTTDQKIKIYNISGKLVEETDKAIIGKNLKKGVYFVKVEGYEFLKIVKMGGLK